MSVALIKANPAARNAVRDRLGPMAERIDEPQWVNGVSLSGIVHGGPDEWSVWARTLKPTGECRDYLVEKALTAVAAEFAGASEAARDMGSEVVSLVIAAGGVEFGEHTDAIPEHVEAVVGASQWWASEVDASRWRKVAALADALGNAGEELATPVGGRAGGQPAAGGTG